MGKVTLVQAAYGTLTREEELAVEEWFADNDRRLILVIIVVEHRRSSGSRCSIHRGPSTFRPGSLTVLKVCIVSRDHRPVDRRICSRCYGGAYLAPCGVRKQRAT